MFCAMVILIAAKDLAGNRAQTFRRTQNDSRMNWTLYISDRPSELFGRNIQVEAVLDENNCR